MTEGWRTALHAYVRAHNRMELEGSAEPLAAVVTDDRHLSRLAARLLRVAESFRERRTKPVQSDTRWRIVHVAEGSRGLDVYVQLRKRHVYHERYVEERVERERLTLSEAWRGWRIVGVAPDESERIESPQAERRQAEIFSPVEEKEASAGRPPSLPYLNRQLVQSDSPSRASRYRRDLAVQYANRWWNASNPAFIEFEVDCTNFVSQCLFAGAIPMNYTGKRDSGWWYRGRKMGQELWSYSWAVSNSFERYLASSGSGLRGEEVGHPALLQPGDIITYDWDGDGRYQHSTMVTAFDPGGQPLVNAHTTNSRYRYWDYRDSYAWSERTTYRFFHIPDMV